MTTYIFSAIAGTTVSGFNPAVDTIQFADGTFTATELSLYQEGADLSVSCAGSSVYLAGIVGTSLSGTQFVFADGSLFRQAPAGGANLLGAAMGDQLLGGAGSDTLRGQGGADTLRGGAGSGSDSLEGGDGNDELDALGGGVDTLAGGSGDDYYLVDAGDVVQELADGGSDGVTSKATWTLGANVERLFLDSGAGAINGYGNDLDNTIIGNDAANRIEGLAGNDWMQGNEGNDTVIGGDGNDHVRGDAGNDSLVGGVGNDSLEGNTGTDTMVGGTGNDYYYVYDAANIVKESADAGLDTVLTFVSYQLTANVEHLSLLGDATIDGTGNAMDNHLYGNAAANVLDGGAGLDWMQGRGGNDTYIVDHAGDRVYETAGDGTDMVLASVSFSLANSDGDGGSEVERLRLTGSGAIDATGNAGDNVIYANDGVNRIDGGAGVDTLSYAYTGGAGPAGVTLNLGALNGLGEAVASGASGADIVKGIENLTGSKHADTLSGDAKANTLNGGAGADTLAGAAGDDVYVVDNVGDRIVELAGGGTDRVESSASFSLADTDGAGANGGNVENLRLTGSANIDATGNAGANTLWANEGVNRIDGGAGVDTLSYQSATAGVTLNLGNVNGMGEATASGSSGADLVKNIENLVGSRHADTLSGDALANLLDGAAGADTLAGGAGNDVYVVDNAGDRIVELAGGGTDLVQSSVSFSLVDTDGAGGNGGNVENLRLMGTGNIDATGNAVANIIYANNGVNVIDGGDGRDTVSFAYVTGTGPTGVTLNLGTLNAQGEAVASGISGADRVKNVEHLVGTTLADKLAGDGGDNKLEGGSGNDTLSGGAGNDVLVGGRDADLMQGASGSDTFRFSALSDTGTTEATWDVIADFLAGVDKIDLAGLDANGATAGDQAFTFIGNAAFSGAGQLRYVYDAGTATGLLTGSTDADAQAEFAIQLTGVAALSASDFLL